MKLFNKGARAFLFHGQFINPDQFFTVPDGKEADAERILKDYPNELISGEDAGQSTKAANAKVTQLEKEVATLKAQNAKLQKLLLATDSTESETALRERAEEAEAQLDVARTKIATLERQINAAIQATVASEATAAEPAPTAENVSTPAAETTTAPQTARTGKKARQI